MAQLYENSYELEQYRDKTLSLYEKGCKFGNAFSCANLGNMYTKGELVDINYVKAAEYYGQACSNKDGLGCYKAAEMYLKEYAGLEVDYEKSMDYYQKACELSISAGCTNLGIMYEEGKGDDVDLEMAAAYYGLACNLKDANGCYYLGIAYEKGLGVEKEEQKSKELYRVACSLGQTDACGSIINNTIK